MNDKISYNFSYLNMSLSFFLLILLHLLVSAQMFVSGVHHSRIPLSHGASTCSSWGVHTLVVVLMHIFARDYTCDYDAHPSFLLQCLQISGYVWCG